MVNTEALGTILIEFILTVLRNQLPWWICCTVHAFYLWKRQALFWIFFFLFLDMQENILKDPSLPTKIGKKKKENEKLHFFHIFVSQKRLYYSQSVLTPARFTLAPSPQRRCHGQRKFFPAQRLEEPWQRSFKAPLHLACSTQPCAAPQIHLNIF